MKKTILPALAMLVIATVMLSTASYAWFALSSQATATGMMVGVKSDSAFLIISKTASVAAGYHETSVDFEETSETLTKIAPTAFTASAMPEENTTYSTTVNDLFNGTGASTIWYTQVGQANNNGTPTDPSVKSFIDYDDVATYLRQYTIYLAVAPETEGYVMSDVTASVTISGDPSVSVLVVGPDGYAHFTNGASGTATTFAVPTDSSDDDNGTLDESINNSFARYDIYVYYNGNHNKITTDNLFASQIFNTGITVNFKTSSNP